MSAQDADGLGGGIGVLVKLARLIFSKEIFRAAQIPAFIALVVMLAGAYYAEQQNNSVYRQNLRTEVLSHLALVRSRIEGNINSNIQLVRGLVAVIETEPGMDQARFAELARNTLSSENQLLNVAAAPDLVISMVYPMEGNESVIGLDYRKNELQREAAMRVRDTGDLVIAGPVDLVQGGQGFIGRVPVFVPGANGEKEFWGIVSAVVDVNQLYLDSGMWNNSPVIFALRGKDATGAEGPQFYGDVRVLQSDPVVSEIRLPSGSWQLSAIPREGWDTVPSNRWTIRAIAALATLIVVIPVFIAGWLIEERVGNLKKLKASEMKFKRVSDRFELALSASQVGVWENQLTQDRLFWDKRMRELMGVHAEGPITIQDFNKALHPDDAERVRRSIKKAVLRLESFKVEFRLVLPSGLIRNLRSVGIVTKDADDNVSVLGINMDITTDVQRTDELNEARRHSEQRNVELEEARARLEYNSLHDALTELPNRRYLNDVLSGKRNTANLKSGPCGVLHLDLDRFKQINDSHGHSAGDAMLVHTANILRNVVDENDFVARIGGDEFVVVCPSDAKPERLEVLAEQIVMQLRRPVNYDGHECRFGVSVGIALAETAPKNPRQMLINADIALYQAKKDGRNGYRFFTQELRKAAIKTKKLADEIMIGLEADQFLVHYQPQFDATTHRITGVEALARWQHPELGLVTPEYFLEAAEELNVIGDLDAIVLQQSLAQMERWRRGGVDVPRVAVNVSAKRLHDETLVSSLKKLQFAPGSLSFELVESIYLDNNDDLVTFNLDQIRDLGIELELDDFGTGHTSILSLMRLRPNRLKIDRQLIQPTLNSSSQRELVRSIVQIGQSLGIEAVAEGVETDELAQVAAQLGCKTLQGYALARPMSSNQVTRFYRKRFVA